MGYSHHQTFFCSCACQVHLWKCKPLSHYH
uniref:Uncharacterized protein n=1 Tax=Anguilla anguilla TaxID=7936 RepID=A0A0E9TSM5_ANGAN